VHGYYGVAFIGLGQLAFTGSIYWRDQRSKRKTARPE
jgi:hypothetical protein